MNTLLCLSLEKGQSLYDPTPDEVQGLPTTKNGLPCVYKWGRGAKIGETYQHPTKKFKVPTNAKSIGNWEDNFHKMQKAGVSVPLVKDHSLKADDTLGYVVNLRRNDGWVEPLLQILGRDALDTVSKNELSLGLKQDFVDGLGNKYPGTAIEHCAATPIPVVPGQTNLSNFSAISGEDGEVTNVFYLSAASTGSFPMATTMSPAHRKMCMNLLSGMDGVNDSTDDDTLMSKMVDEHGKMQKDMAMNIPAMKAKTGTLEDQVKALSRENEELTEQVNLSRTDKVVNTEVLFERSLRVGKDADLLVTNRICTPAVAQEFREVLMGTKDAPNVFSLSREEGADDCLAAKVIAVALKFTPPPGTGMQSGTQTLSRDNVQSGAEGSGMRTIKSPHTGKEVQVPVN